MLNNNNLLPVVSVSQFIAQVNDIIVGEFIIEGEVSQCKISQGKWIFFDLKDDTAVLNCFSTVFMLKIPLEEGMRVRVKGYPKIHDKSGRFSFTVQSVEMVGEGSLQRAYLLLKQKLTAEGLFDSGRKRPLPFLPERIGIIASADSAAFGDFKRILNNRWAGAELWLRSVAVQGESAVQEIVQAFEEFNEQAELCDVLVLIRGGGSLPDLAAFNSEAVVRAIVHSRLPVICGVGHERDESLADFAADRRASTPSNAAEIIVPDKKELAVQLDFTVEHCFQTLEHAITLRRQRLEQMTETLFRSLERKMTTAEELTRMAEMILKNANPSRILNRGFSIVRNKQGSIVRTVEQVTNKDKVTVAVSNGSFAAQVLN